MDAIEGAAAGIPAPPPERRRHRLRVRTAVIAGAVLVALVAIAFATGFAQVYDAPGNAGIVIGPSCHNVGFEWRGAPGDPSLFFNSCS